MGTLSVYTITGIIISRKNTGEADKILTLLAYKYGKKRVIAKGIRKSGSRRAPHLELFSKTTLLCHKTKTLDVVSEASLLNNYGEKYKNLKHISLGYIVLECICRMLPEGSEHDSMYQALDIYLKQLIRYKDGEADRFTIRFLDYLLWTLGYKKKEEKSKSLIESIAKIETILERPLRSKNIYSRASLMR